MSSKGRKLPKVFEYSELFLQLLTWYKHLDSLDMVRNLQLIHSNRINHELYSEPTFPAPQLYLLRHTLRKYVFMEEKVEHMEKIRFHRTYTHCLHSLRILDSYEPKTDPTDALCMIKNTLQEWHAYIRTMVQFHVLALANIFHFYGKNRSCICVMLSDPWMSP